MHFDRKFSAAVGVVLGSAIFVTSQPHIDCLPRLEMCGPPTAHPPDMPHHERASAETPRLIAVSSASATTHASTVPYIVR